MIGVDWCINTLYLLLDALGKSKKLYITVEVFFSRFMITNRLTDFGKHMNRFIQKMKKKRKIFVKKNLDGKL